MKKRVVDRDFLDAVAQMNCVVCNNRPCDPDHIKTRGSGGGDEVENVWPLCRAHHVERHQIGLQSFVRKHPKIAEELIRRGWGYDVVQMKWTRGK